MKSRLFVPLIVASFILCLTTGTISQELVVGGDMEDASAWQSWDCGSTVQSDLVFGYTDDVPKFGKGGCLNILAMGSVWTQHIITQPLTMESGMWYYVSAAFTELTGGDRSGAWTQIYLSTDAPVEGQDYDPPGMRFLGFNGFVGCGGSGVDGTFQDDACEGPGPFYLAPGNPGEGPVTVHMIIKSGCWTDGSTTIDVDILIDEVSVVPLTNYVVDPGFEEETAFTDTTAPGWNHWFDEECFLDDLYPYSGTWCGSFPESPLTWDEYADFSYGQEVGGLTPGATYTLTGFARLDWYTGDTSIEWGIYWGVQDFAGPGSKLGGSSVVTDWVPFVHTFTMGDTNVTADIWGWQGPGAEAATDDWSVRHYHNYLKNAGFESNTLWDLWAYNAAVETDTNHVISGEFAAVINGISWGGGFAQQVKNLVPGCTYGITASAKVVTEGDTVYFGVKNYGGDEIFYKIGSTNYTSGVISFTQPEGSDTAEVYIWKDHEGTAYCDDFLMVKMFSPDEAAVTSVKQINHADLPKSFELQQNYPNPFNPTTSIGFSLAETGNVRLEIYNMLGQRVRTLMNRPMIAGHHEVTWDAKDDLGRTVAAGVYFYRLKTQDNLKFVKKMVLMK